MKLENQVCSLELAQKLKELGVERDSIFWWCNTPQGFELNFVRTMEDFVTETGGTYDRVSAFTIAELGEILPDIQGYRLNITNPFGKKWDIEYRAAIYDAKYGEVLYAVQTNSEADARALMLIYLYENNLITNKEV